MKQPNRHGSALLELCKTCGLRILNGRSGRDATVGECTYQGTNGKSVVDYILCHNRNLKRVLDFNIEKTTVHSDHNLVYCQLLRHNHDTCNQDTSYSSNPARKLIWDCSKRIEFTQQLGSDVINVKFQIYSVKDVIVRKKLKHWSKILLVYC